MPGVELLLTITNRMGCGSVLLDSTGQIENFNIAAEKIFGVRDLDRDEKVEDLKLLIKDAIHGGSNRFRIDSESWIVIPREGMRPLALHAVPAGEGTDAYSKTLLLIIDLNENRNPSPVLLNNLFGLTPSEVNIAIQIAHGRTPAEIALDRKITLWTVRSQLAAIFAKTQTRRQSDLVALLLKIAMLS